MSAGSLDKIVSDYYTISRMDISIVDRDFRSLFRAISSSFLSSTS